MGTLNGLIAAIYPASTVETMQTADRETHEPVQKPQVKAAEQEHTEPKVQETPIAVEIDDRKVQKADIQVNEPVDLPESSTADSEVPVEKAAPSAVGGFYIHIYSFRTPERADSFVRRWDHPQYGITTHAQNIRGVDWYRIYLGPFETRDMALWEALRLKQDETIDYYKVITLPSG